MRKIAIFLFIVTISVSCAFAGGRSDSYYVAGAVSRAAATLDGERRILAAYVVEDAGSGNQSEGLYLPQAAAAYFPTAFSVSSKERKLSFDRQLSYRVVSKAALAAGVRVYTIEAPAVSASPGKERAEGGRSYVFSFPRSVLGKSGSGAMQPAPYALERAIRIASASRGIARLESLRYDESTELFKASVHVVAQSINK